MTALDWGAASGPAWSSAGGLSGWVAQADMLGAWRVVGRESEIRCWIGRASLKKGPSRAGRLPGFM